MRCLAVNFVGASHHCPACCFLCFYLFTLVILFGLRSGLMHVISGPRHVAVAMSRNFHSFLLPLPSKTLQTVAILSQDLRETVGLTSSLLCCGGDERILHTVQSVTRVGFCFLRPTRWRYRLGKHIRY